MQLYSTETESDTVMRTTAETAASVLNAESFCDSTLTKTQASQLPAGRRFSPSHTLSGVASVRQPVLPGDAAEGETLRRKFALTGRGHNAVVLSMVGNRTDFDWCGSVAQAMKLRATRIASGEYERVCLRRVRLTCSRRDRAKRLLYANAFMEWRRAPRVPDIQSGPVSVRDF
jgi:hypothetical protein